MNRQILLVMFKIVKRYFLTTFQPFILSHCINELVNYEILHYTLSKTVVRIGSELEPKFPESLTAGIRAELAKKVEFHMDYFLGDVLQETCPKGLHYKEKTSFSLGARYEGQLFLQICSGLELGLIHLKLIPFGLGKPQKEQNPGGQLNTLSTSPVNQHSVGYMEILWIQ